MALYTLSCTTTGAGSGSTSGGNCGWTTIAGLNMSLAATTNAGSTFGGWSCIGTGGYSQSSASGIYTFSMPSENVACTATFNLAPPPPVAASVESDLALFLTFLGVIAITGFQRWRKRAES